MNKLNITKTGIISFGLLIIMLIFYTLFGFMTFYITGREVLLNDLQYPMWITLIIGILNLKI